MFIILVALILIGNLRSIYNVCQFFYIQKVIVNILFSGQPSWGIAWYINDLLIPEIYVERGQTYTFKVEGGNEQTNPARYHPFYITDSSEGGFGQKSEAEQKKQRVFAGVSYDADGYPYPTAGELDANCQMLSEINRDFWSQ